MLLKLPVEIICHLQIPTVKSGLIPAGKVNSFLWKCGNIHEESKDKSPPHLLAEPSRKAASSSVESARCRTTKSGWRIFPLPTRVGVLCHALPMPEFYLALLIDDLLLYDTFCRRVHITWRGQKQVKYGGRNSEISQFGGIF
jgi:hypothetical protein